MTAPDLAVWDDALRKHDRQVYLSVLALGLPPDRAREVTQAAWTRLIEQHAQGKLDHIEPGGGVFALAHRTHHHAPPAAHAIATLRVKLTPNVVAPHRQIDEEDARGAGR